MTDVPNLRLLPLVSRLHSVKCGAMTSFCHRPVSGYMAVSEGKVRFVDLVFPRLFLKKGLKISQARQDMVEMMREKTWEIVVVNPPNDIFEPFIVTLSSDDAATSARSGHIVVKVVPVKPSSSCGEHRHEET